MKKLSTLTALVFALLLSNILKAVPKLSSYPAASATIFLDFDGHYVNSGVWNGGTPFACGAAAWDGRSEGHTGDCEGQTRNRCIGVGPNWRWMSMWWFQLHGEILQDLEGVRGARLIDAAAE